MYLDWGIMRVHCFLEINQEHDNYWNILGPYFQWFAVQCNNSIFHAYLLTMNKMCKIK